MPPKAQLPPEDAIIAMAIELKANPHVPVIIDFYPNDIFRCFLCKQAGAVSTMAKHPCKCLVVQVANGVSYQDSVDNYRQKNEEHAVRTRYNILFIFYLSLNILIYRRPHRSTPTRKTASSLVVGITTGRGTSKSFLRRNSKLRNH
jgi:hypothetical protein